MVVARRHHDPAAVDDLERALLHAAPELVVERLVHLVEQQDLRLEPVHDGEAQTRPHAL